METKTQERNYGIDLLRIVSMLMVVILHLLGKGDVLGSGGGVSFRYASAWMFEAAAHCAVNCYALISGYVGVQAKYRYTNFAMLWLHGFFYSVLLTVPFLIFKPETRSLWTLVSAVLPIFRGQWWYLTAYAFLFLLMPMLNFVVRNVPKKQFRAVLTVVFAAVFVSNVLSSFNAADFGLDDGYSALWLALLYLLGGYIREYDPFSDVSSKKLVLLYAGAVLLTWGLKIGVEFFLPNGISGHAIPHSFLYSYLSSTVVLSAVALLTLFSRMRIRGGAVRSIGFFAPLSFGVYLIHEHPLFREYCFVPFCDKISEWFGSGVAFAIVPLAVLIFVALTLVDYLRLRLFGLLRLRQRLSALEQKLFPALWRDAEEK